jgi:hypothetical protein
MAVVPTPCEFGQDFLDDLPYDPSVLLFDRLLEVDEEHSMVRARMVTDPPLPLTDQQRTDPVVHPRHLAGGLILHATGMLGFIHGYYVLGLRHREGWTGYGTHVHRAVFRQLVPPGTAVEGTCRAIRQRLGEARHFIRYQLLFNAEGRRFYEGEQSAMWLKPSESPVPLLGEDE